jgi:hypothetical protein
METVLKIEFIRTPSEEGKLKCIREKNQMDEKKHESWLAKPEEIITELDHRGASHHIAFLLDS